ncbi:hypothetical protein H311_00882 [Anncaliia algerae PRA109]|nr:hypothetical protein H311_00882 [Anncaliia algerae PRA109]
MNPLKVLVMYFARFHHSHNVLSMLRNYQIPVKFLPPYIPQLNPIEESFLMLKSKHNAIKKGSLVMKMTIWRFFLRILEISVKVSINI